MNLRPLSDKTLLENTECLVKRERELLSEILHHFREIEVRRLFCDLGFGSLWEYVTKHLGYSEDQAARRISALKLLKELPEIENKITDGSLSLTNLSQVQSHFRQQKKNSNELNREQKLELLEQITNKSKRQAEVIIARQSSSLDMHTLPSLGDLNKTEICIKADTELQSKIEKVKGLIAHTHPGIDMVELLNYLCDLAIKKLDPAQKPTRTKKSPAPGQVNLPAPSIVTTQQEQAIEFKRNYIPAATRQKVWQRAQSQCEDCHSRYALQVEHTRPVAKGGDNNIENLKLLCRRCNQRSAIKHFGQKKMFKWLSVP